MKPTALVADDFPELLEMTASLLELNGVRIVSKDHAGEQAMDHLRNYQPNLAVIDVHLPGYSGLALLQKIRHEGLPTRCILVTGHQREAWLIEALELGVEGYMLKPFVEYMQPAIKQVLEGGRFLCPWATGIVIADYVRLKADEKTHHLLTPRELQVLRYRVQGKSVKETAAQIDVSPKTIEKHVTQLRKKLGSNGSATLSTLASRIKLDL